MGVFDWFRSKSIVVDNPAPKRRTFSAAQIGRLLGDFTTQNYSIDSDLRRALKILKARSRDLSLNNPYAKKFDGTLRQNIVGPNGINLQVLSKSRTGKLDKLANKKVEKAWKRAGKRGHFDVTTKLSRSDAERLFISTVSTDGECLVKLIPGHGPSNYAVQFLDTARLDPELNHEAMGASPRIVMGVELDSNDAPIGYHIKVGRNPDDVFRFGRSQDLQRIPADQMIHGFIVNRTEQTRGIPWMHAAILELQQIGGYRDAALIAARIGAHKLGWFKGESGTPLGTGDDVDSDGTVIMDAEPGEFGQLTSDAELISWDPPYPHEQFGAFVKAGLRGVASGLGVAYNTFANDLEGVSFGTQRSGTLDERDLYIAIQNWMIGSWSEPLYEEWLRFQLTTQVLPEFSGLALNQFEKLTDVHWQGRRWSWLDPHKDAQTRHLELKMNVNSEINIMRELGRDPDQILDERQLMAQMLEERGLPPVNLDGVSVTQEESQSEQGQG